jgi:hypothetical protein
VSEIVIDVMVIFFRIVVKFNVNHSIESADDHMGYEEEEDTPQSHEHEVFILVHIVVFICR